MSQANQEIDMTATAIATQKLDAAERPGWLKIIAPAKVNLYLGIGERRDDGYHAVQSVLHALCLHDVVYMRAEPAAPGTGLAIEAACEGRAGVVAPAVPSDDNIAVKAIRALAERIGRNADEIVRVRIVKNIPSEAGLGGGSSDAAAALLGAARLWGVKLEDEEVEEAAHTLGSDVAFFLRGGCGYYDGTGEMFQHSLEPAKTNVVLVKPARGVSTRDAYRTFDENPGALDDGCAKTASASKSAADVELFNNLAAASEKLMPELAEIRAWLLGQPGVTDALLCGSGSTTFALCDSFAAACAVVAEATKRGWWARTTALGPVRAAIVS